MPKRDRGIECYGIIIWFKPKTQKWYVVRDGIEISEHENEPKARASAEDLADKIWNTGR